MSPIAVVVGDGPVGLANAIVLRKLGYSVYLFKERQFYSRKHELRFNQAFFSEFSRQLLGLRPDVNSRLDDEGIADYNIEFARLLGKPVDNKEDVFEAALVDSFVDGSNVPVQGGIPQYVTFNFPNERKKKIRHADYAEFRLFKYEPFVAIQSKHLEQALLNRLRQLNTGSLIELDSKPCEQQPTGAVTALGAQTGELRYISSSTQNTHVLKPSIVIAADGAHSHMVDLYNQSAKDDALKFHVISAQKQRPEHQAHAINTYTFVGNNYAEIATEFRHAFRSKSRIKAKHQPTRQQLIEMGWKLPRNPSRRIFLSKDGLYVGCEIPQKIKDSKPAIERWQRLVMRFDLPRDVVRRLIVKSNADTQKRQKRRQLQFTSFDVTCQGGLDDSIKALGENRSLFIVAGDALEQGATNYQTATGARFGLKLALELGNQLANQSREHNSGAKQVEDVYRSSVAQERNYKHDVTRRFITDQKQESRDVYNSRRGALIRRLNNYLQRRPVDDFRSRVIASILLNLVALGNYDHLSQANLQALRNDLGLTAGLKKSSFLRRAFVSRGSYKHREAFDFIRQDIQAFVDDFAQPALELKDSAAATGAVQYRLPS